MTTKVHVVNFGPDPILVRVVDYGPQTKELNMPPLVLSDNLLQVQESRDFYVHTEQQLLIGEKRATE